MSEGRYDDTEYIAAVARAEKAEAEVKRLRKALGQIAAQAVGRGMENPWNISARRIARAALGEVKA